MINFYNIVTVARYERKILYRSWFFRIFSIIALLFLFGINMGLFVFPRTAQWTYRAIAANLPYINVLFINIAQAIIAVFLASDFLRRDKKLDTTEVIYTRPVSNGEYVVGKTTGILTLFVGLVIVALAMALVFNLIRQDTPVVWQAYIFYPLLITIPTLIFILGFSFLLMIIIRNQAVTFILLLGYIGLTLFYFRDKLYGLFDYMAFNLPMVWSDFIGFGDPAKIILHRIAYLFLGTGFIFATIRFLNRLPQVGRWNIINILGFIIFLFLGGTAGFNYYSGFRHRDSERAAYLALNNFYASKPAVDIISNTLSVFQKGQKLEISSEVMAMNQDNQIIDTLLFSLNPGFKIDSITSEKGKCRFIRNRQIVQLIQENGLAAGNRAKYIFYYTGVPDESIAYLDIPDENMKDLKRLLVAVVDKKPGIIAGDFTLLTPELLWYPVAGVGFNTIDFLIGKQDFVNFSLSVKPKNHLTVIAPGRAEVKDGIFSFTPETDLNAFPMIIGPFEKKSLTVEGVEYNLFIKPGHDYFSGFFSNITDTLGYLIKEAKDNYEIDVLDLYYPFKRINLVEVPVQFHFYDRPQKQSLESIQPEIIFLPEKGTGLNSTDFARFKYFEDRSNRLEQTRTEKDIEINQFRRFLESTFFRSMTVSSSLLGPRPQSEAGIFTFRGSFNFGKNPYNVFPLYYSYMTGISSADYPVFNSMMELYLKEGYAVSPRQSFFGEMTITERANLALRDHSLTEIFSSQDANLTSTVITQAGSFIFMGLKNKVGLGEFDNFLYNYLEAHAFEEIPFKQFAADFYEEFEVEIEPYFETITTRSKLPVFLISTPEYIISRDEIGFVYLVRLKITNRGDVKGLIDISFRMSGEFGGGSTSEQRSFELDPGITKDIQITLYDQPMVLMVNTLISGNIPSSFFIFLRSAESVDVAGTEEYEKISDTPVIMRMDGEYIVDNEDPGFNYVSLSKESKLKQYIDARKKTSDEIYYSTVNPRFPPPSVWTPVAHSAFYGEAIRSSMIIRNGDGSNMASWTTVLPSAGFYDVYTYIPMSAMIGRQSGRERGGRGYEGGSQGQRGGSPGGGYMRTGGGSPGGGGSTRMGGRYEQDRRGQGPSFADYRFTYNYIISSNEGTEEVEFTLVNIEEGWNRLGTFHFPGDTVKIELTDKTNGNRIFADAVKWVGR